MTRPTLERQIYNLLAGSGLTLATAESCTGGLVSYRVTSVGGSSSYFLGGIVAYSNDLKRNLLGVSNETLERRGAVSAECAREMAEGTRAKTGATIAAATTGIAGPGGATVRKPVGLIYIACSSPLGTRIEEVHWRGDRERNMYDATEYALRMIVMTAEELVSEAG